MSITKFFSISLILSTTIAYASENAALDKEALQQKLAAITRSSAVIKSAAVELIRARGVDGQEPQVLLGKCEEPCCVPSSALEKGFFVITEKMKRKIARSKRS